MTCYVSPKVINKRWENNLNQTSIKSENESEKQINLPLRASEELQKKLKITQFLTWRKKPPAKINFVFSLDTGIFYFFFHD